MDLQAGLTLMAYDAVLTANQATAIVAEPRDYFLRSERLVLLTGAVAIGALMGFAATIMTGRTDPWVVIATAAVAITFALYLTSLTLVDALRRDARGCAIAAGLHCAALLSWPMTSLLVPLSEAIYWIAPVAALSSLVLFASCWGGSARAVYRMTAQGALVAALAAHQGALLIMAG
ncbi:hypothetical protein [Vitreimonas flagellata]|uniref:hypothetical protein n=1 Tax=Vitreimonas flagellata TaxID=2560861 RepID=UPI001430824E|nr:hypothetical protein [Vitreimonas flagellata]